MLQEKLLVQATSGHGVVDQQENVVCVYCLSTEEKDTSYERVFSINASVPEENILVLGGDFNGHIGDHSAGFEGVHGGSRYGMRN